MNTLTLIIGNKNYSSWSLRPWLLLRHAEIPFSEIKIPLYTPAAKQEILKYSANGKVPVLKNGDITVWESLAICEYLAEKFPDRHLWPDAPDARALARSISMEMHAGFPNLRHHMSMNCRKFLPGKGRGPGVEEEIDRITAIWGHCRRRFTAAGDFLFGGFTIADAMFAPVALRFTTYGVTLDSLSDAYVKTLLALPAIQAWISEARAEPEIIEACER